MGIKGNRRGKAIRLVLAAAVIGCGLTGVVATTSVANAATPQSVANLALANVGKGAGSCSTVNSSPNSLGGTAFYNSCTANGGNAVYWCAEFARWVWGNNGINITGLNAESGSFVSAASSNGSTVHSNASYVPHVGDAVVYDYNGNGNADHVGLVTSVNSDGSVGTANGDFNGTEDQGQVTFAKTSKVVPVTLAASQRSVGSTPSNVGMTITDYVTPAGLTASAPAAAPAGSSAVIGAAGSYHVFSVNGDDDLYQGYYTSGNAWAWQNLGGDVVGTPGVTYISASNRYDVFAVGTNGVMYQQTFSGGTWSGWNAIGGSNFLGGVSATIGADGSYHIFAMNASHVLIHGYYTVGNGWSWQSLGGTVFGTPAVTYRATGNRYDVFAAGTSGAMYQKTFANGAWGDWNSIGGSNFGTGTSAVYAPDNSYHVFTVNTAGVAYQAYYTASGGWTWQSLGGTVAGTPGVTYVAASNRFDLFAPSPNTGSMYQQIYSGGTWGGWNSIGGSNFN